MDGLVRLPRAAYEVIHVDEFARSPLDVIDGYRVDMVDVDAAGYLHPGDSQIAPVIAQYDPAPRPLPFLRRVEYLVEISRRPEGGMRHGAVELEVVEPLPEGGKSDHLGI